MGYAHFDMTQNKIVTLCTAQVWIMNAILAVIQLKFHMRYPHGVN